MSNYGPEQPGPASDPWEHSAPDLADLDLGYTQPHQRPRESGGSKALLVVLVGILVVVLCGGGVAGLYLIGNRGSAGQQGGTGGSASATVDPTTIRVGDCMTNSGTVDSPKVRIVSCAPHTYKVLSKIEGTTDKEACRPTANTDQVFFYDAHDQALDFVLCLQSL